jgi:hypothetical protein
VIDQHHPDPRECTAIGYGGRGCHHTVTDASGEAALRLGFEQSPPIAIGLIPAGKFLESHRRRNIALREQADAQIICCFIGELTHDPPKEN